MKNIVLIRKANFSDLEELAHLFDAYRVFYKQGSDEESARIFLADRMKNDESIIFVAEENGKLIGFAQLYPIFSSVSMQRSLILNDLYVMPSERGRGVATKLLERSKLCAVEKKAKGLSLETAMDNPAQGLYERLGWKKDQEFFHYFWTAKKHS